MRTAVITGGTGFIGSHLIKMLTDQGWTVKNIPRTENPELIYSIMASVKPDVVFHLASLFLSEHTPEDIPELVASNITFGTYVLDAMKKAGVKRIVNAGSIWQHPADTLYGATKNAFQAVLNYYCVTHVIRSSTILLADTYGPGDTRRKLVSTLLKATREDGPPLDFVPKESRIELVHVEDVCRGFIAAAGNVTDQIPQMIFQLAVMPVAIAEVVEIFETISGKTLAINWGARTYRDRTNEKTRGPNPLGWTQKISLYAGISGLLK